MITAGTITAVRFSMGLYQAQRLAAEIRGRRTIRASVDQAPAVGRMIETMEDFERELSRVMTTDVDEPADELLRTLREFQISYNAALAAGWKP